MTDDQERGVLKALGRFRRHAGGSAIVDFGLLAAPFLALIAGGAQLFVVSLAQQMLETTAETAGRLILTGNAQNLTQQQFQQKLCPTLPAILSCSNVMVDVQTAKSFAQANTSTPTLTYDQQGKISNNWQFNTGGAGDIVVMRLMYQWPVINALTFNLANMQGNARLLFATTVFKNEAF